MGCLNANITKKHSIVAVVTKGYSNIVPTLSDVATHPIANISLVCSIDNQPSFAWGDDIRLLWDNGGLILIDKEYGEGYND